MLRLLDWIIVSAVVPLARVLGERRLAAGRPRALWAATPILTLPLKARATRLLGFDSTSLVFGTYYISQSFDLNLRKLAGGASRLGGFASALMDRLILVWALLRYDVFHYFFDRGLMRPASRFGIRLEELDFLAASGKRVYGFAYGADVRLRQKTLALGRWNFCAECPAPKTFCLCDDAEGDASLRAIEARLTAPVALGDMLAYFDRPVNLHYWPVAIEDVTPAPPRPATGRFTIAHAPNHTHFKGSRHLEAAIDILRAQGHDIAYVKVQGVPNAKVLRLFAEADLVADQFIGGAYGYTALEAMALGKPVLTYVRRPDLVEAPEECPLINATPDTLEETLRWCVCNREALVGIGVAGRAYVARWHSIEAVAARLGRLYRKTGDFPAPVLARIEAQSAQEEARRAGIAPVEVRHPFRIDAATCARLDAAATPASAPAGGG